MGRLHQLYKIHFLLVPESLQQKLLINTQVCLEYSLQNVSPDGPGYKPWPQSLFAKNGCVPP